MITFDKSLSNYKKSKITTYTKVSVPMGDKNFLIQGIMWVLIVTKCFKLKRNVFYITHYMTRHETGTHSSCRNNSRDNGNNNESVNMISFPFQYFSGGCISARAVNINSCNIYVRYLTPAAEPTFRETSRQ